MLRQLYYSLLPYRSIVVPFLVVTAIAVPCWLAFRLYRRRTPEHRLTFARELLLLIVVVYLSGLAAATLEPNRPSREVADAMSGIELRPDLASLTCSSASLPRGSTARAFCVRNARGNVALFFPLGILLPLVWRRLRFWKGIQIAAALSVGIELLQYVSRAWGSYRLADVNDVILNVAGAALGLSLVFLLRWRPASRPTVARA
jgi:glycopeptide antibiotics resistance protein